MEGNTRRHDESTVVRKSDKTETRHHFPAVLNNAYGIAGYLGDVSGILLHAFLNSINVRFKICKGVKTFVSGFSGHGYRI